MRASFALLLFLVLCQPAAAQLPGASENALVQGTVLGSDTGQPLRRARVQLARLQGRGQPLVSITGVDGRFTFPAVPPGTYRLLVDRNGYVRQEYGQRNSQRGTPLTISPGQTIKDLEFRLIRGGVITGRVYDEEGEPVARAPVRIMRLSYERGRRGLIPTGNDSTNDLGEYRIFDLPPGRYYLSATGRSGPGGRVFFGGTAEEGAEDVYAPVFFPGTTDPARAQPVELGPGQHISGIDLQLMTADPIQVRGTVTNGVTGQPVRRAQVMLLPRNPFATEFSGRSQGGSNELGAFDVRVLTPGSYYLMAMWNEGNVAMVGRIPVEVGSSNLEGLDVTVSPGVELTGKIKLEGKPDANLERVRIGLRPRDFVPFYGGGRGQVKPDGAFVIQNVMEDTYLVSVTGTSDEVYLKSVRVGGQDVLESGLTVGRGRPVSGIEVTLSAAAGRLDGLVLGEDSLPAEATVALVPTAARREQVHLYKNTRTDQLGRFSLTGIAPGEYKVFAFEEVEVGALEDPEFVRTIEDRGTTVRIAESSAQTAEVKRIPAGPLRP